ncbi:exodeoxyribonuclease V subunit alpha [Nakamurella sp. YIM 132087]|uniref:RecBCD enzyme subunit RecD n=1 Tax=Nakamurella alba TaxID=2665158 RepID=A0A7K1FF00_9ACTN|nr:exodeoxyribonuclease V subunit alpha [Nakamurella alba]MTD12660.1 exodeoxyribonuclease V subunit alpha [Nakamurella alba]
MTAPVDPMAAGFALRATGLLRDFNQAGLLDAGDVHVASRLSALAGETDETVSLALALAVAAVRGGSVCVDLTDPPVIDTTEVTSGATASGAGVAPEAVPPWPEPGPWIAAVRRSPLTADLGAGPDLFGTWSDDLTEGSRPLRYDRGLLYLDRYWRDECDVAADLAARERSAGPSVDAARLDRAVVRYFRGPDGDPRTDDHDDRAAELEAWGITRRAARTAATRWTTVLGGGPGTGKTTTVARLLAVLTEISDPGAPGSRKPGSATGVAPGPLRIALAAPTGKAAARLQEAVTAEIGASVRPVAPEIADRLGALQASTLHRLLGAVGGRGLTFRHDRTHRLPHDVVVVDEASMISLTLMARLLAAMRPDARLVLVGDPAQLASVEAGAVLADIVDGLDGLDGAGSAPVSGEEVDGVPSGGTVPGRAAGAGIVRLEHNWRFGGDIALLATAVRRGDIDGATEILDASGSAVEFLPDGGTAGARADVVAAGRDLRAAAIAGDAAAALRHLDAHRLLCAHRAGPTGVDHWRRQVEAWLAADRGEPESGPWYPGRPVLITANDYPLGLFNGDTGVVVLDADGEPRVVFARGTGTVSFRPTRLDRFETVHAMTVHRSQGSQFGTVTLVLPEVGSPLLTRELLYTAITRARNKVRILGDREAFAAAVARPAARASGLRGRLGG